MKKIVILAISAILVANVSAQEQKKECSEFKKFSQEERVEFDIKRFTHELMLSDQQAEQFASTYREYAGKLVKIFQKNAPAKFEPGKTLTDADRDKMAKQRFEGFKEMAELQSKYYDDFRKFLSAQQTSKVLIFNEPFDKKPFFGKHEGKFDGKFCGKPEGPRPGCGKKHCHHPHGEAPKFADQAE